MKQRGRPSSSALAVVPISGALDRVPRQPAPDELTEEEAEVWLTVVNSEPADWFTPANVPLLTQYCRHVVNARRVARLIEAAVADEGLTVVDYDRLLKMQERETSAIQLLATKMRLAQTSTINQRGNQKKAQQSGQKLWSRISA